MSFCPWPFVDFYVDFGSIGEIRIAYLWSEFVITIMWFRLFFLVRSLLNYCQYTDAYAKSVSKQLSFTADTRFTFKCYMKRDPVTTIFVVFCITIFSLAYVLRIFELPFFDESADPANQLDSYFNAVWCIVITLTTVGYGDISPSTIPGRMICMISALWGAFLIGAIVSCLNDTFGLTYEQELALGKIRLSRKAARTIQASFRYFASKKKYVKEKLKENKAHNIEGVPGYQLFVKILTCAEMNTLESKFEEDCHEKDKQKKD